MRPFCTPAALATTSLTALLCGTAHAGEVAVKSARKVGNFSQISVSSAFDIDIKHGKSPQVIVEAPRSAQKFIQATVKNGQLWVGINGHHNIDGPLKLHVVTTELTGIELSGACQLSSREAWKAKSFRISLSGACQTTLPIEAGSADLDVTGASQLKLTGKVSALRLAASGGSIFSGYGLQTKIANVHADGASTLQLNVQSILSAVASGASTIEYRGTKKVNAEATGAASIRRS